MQPLQPFLPVFSSFLCAPMHVPIHFSHQQEPGRPLKSGVQNRVLFGSSSGLPVVCAGFASGNPEQTPEQHPNKARPMPPNAKTKASQVRARLLAEPV